MLHGIKLLASLDARCLPAICLSKRMTQDSHSVIELLRLFLLDQIKKLGKAFKMKFGGKSAKGAEKALFSCVEVLHWHYWFWDKVLKYLGTRLVALCFGLSSLCKLLAFFLLLLKKCPQNKTTKNRKQKHLLSTRTSDFSDQVLWSVSAPSFLITAYRNTGR